MTSTTINEEELRAARYASLRAHPISHAAEALVGTLASMVEEHELATGTRKNKRKSKADTLKYATGAFLADLLSPYGDDEPTPNPWVYRSLQGGKFAPAVPRRTFVPLVESLKGLGFLWQVESHKVSQKPGEFASRFRATPALLAFCGERGVNPAQVHDHFEFEYDLPEEVLQKRATKEGGYWIKTKPPGKPMNFDKGGIAQSIADVVRELNEFFARQKLRGGSHHGYVRIFHNGDDPTFSWNLGGRLYSQHPHSYQSMSAEKRLKMTINDKPVAEIDIKASYLTIFLALNGIQLDIDADPYELPGLGAEHRPAVKSWMVATFGSSKPAVRWPSRMLKDNPELRSYRVKIITEAALNKYPALRGWGELKKDGHACSWADLMYEESVVMIGTMLDLKNKHNTPSLSVHDSLIVPAHRADVAIDALEARFRANLGATPLLSRKVAKNV